MIALPLRTDDRARLWTSRNEKSTAAWHCLCRNRKSAIRWIGAIHPVRAARLALLEDTMKPVPAPAACSGDESPAAPLRLAVIVPTLNERDNIATMVAALDAALAGIAWEAIFVDDDSRDGTQDEVERVAI